MHDGADKDAILEAIPELKDVSEDELEFRYKSQRFVINFFSFTFFTRWATVFQLKFPSILFKDRRIEMGSE